MNRPLSITTQLYALIAIIILPFIAFLALMLYNEARFDQEQARIAVQNLSAITVRDTQEFLRNAESLLRRVAQRQASSSPDKSTCDSVFNNFHDFFGEAADLVLFDVNSQIVCRSDHKNSAIIKPDLRLIRKTISGKSFLVSDVIRNEITGRFFTFLMYPVTYDNGSSGVLCMSVGVAAYQPMVSGVSLPANGQIVILDSQGTDIAVANDPKRWVGKNLGDTGIVKLILKEKNGYTVTTGVDGTEKIFNFLPIPGSGWYAMAALPTQVVFANVKQKTVQNVVFLSALCSVILLGSLMLIRRIRNPISNIVGTARRVAAGDLGVRATIFGPREIREVALQFNTMLDTLERNKEALRKHNEQWFRSFVMEIKDYAIYLVSVKGEVQSWNSGAKNIKQYEEHEIVGKDFSCFYTSEDRLKGKPQENLRNAIANGRYEEEGWRVRKDGSQFWAFVSITALHDENGGLRGLVKITQDISQRKKIEDLFRGLIESAPDAMVVLNADGTIMFTNSMTEKLFGYAREMLVGKPVEILIPERYRSSHIGFRNNYFERPIFRPMGPGLDLWGLRQDNTEFPVDISLASFQTEEGVLFTAAIRDITERKRAQQELEAFSYSVSHDLRAPLRAISGFAHILSEEYITQLDNRGRHYLGNIIKASNRMSALIEDLLAYARLGRKTITLRPVPLNSVLNDVLTIFEEQIKTSEAQINIGDLPTVQGDATLLGQVFTNLLENALTYRKPDVSLHISILSDIHPDHTVIKVIDNGIGIPSDYYEKVFQVFQRLHTEETYPGTGIGLAIVKKSVELMGGRIWVNSALGQGSEFCVKLIL